MIEYQGNKLFKEGDSVYFDPIFNRIRDKEKYYNSRPSEKLKSGIAAIKKSLKKKSVYEKPDNGDE